MKKLTFGWIGSPQQLIRVILGCVILSGSLVFSSGAFALTLEQAKQQGRVGETLSGYLAPVKKDAETLALVEQINIARAEKYQEVAQKKLSWRGKSWLTVRRQGNMCAELTASGCSAEHHYPTAQLIKNVPKCA